MNCARVLIGRDFLMNVVLRRSCASAPDANESLLGMGRVSYSIPFELDMEILPWG